MPIDTTSTASLLGAYGAMDRIVPVLLNLFFPMEQVFTTEEVYFDKVTRARRLAPFVVPTVAGKPEPARSYTTLGFKPPYLKPKHVIEPTKTQKRRAGERLLGSYSPRERFELALIDNLQMEDAEITRREEWMAAQLLTTGSMLCQGPDFPAVLIDLKRPAGNSVTLTGALTWGSPGIDPLENLQDWAAYVQGVSGAHPGVVVMDPLAGRAFTRSPGVLQVMNSFRQTSGNIDLAGKVTGGAYGNEAKYLGSIGEFDIWQYQQLYWDELANTVRKFMPDNSIIMGNPDACGGVRTYGAIMDLESLTPLSRFPKVWPEKDPSAFLSMTQSAPLPLLGWSEATFSAVVA